MTKRAEKLLILSLLTGFFLFLIFCSCKNENLIDPLDILNKNNPGLWPVCGDCGVFTPSGQSLPAPPPENGAVSICTGPNPTAGPICFQYLLPSDMNVSLAIFTEKGESVATIVREAQTVGPHVYQWNLESDSGIPVANGTYRAYFMAGGYVTHGDIVVRR